MSNLTLSEQERAAWLAGDHRLAALLDAAERLSVIDDCECPFSDVYSGFPGEDCLRSLMDDLLDIVPVKYHRAMLEAIDAAQSELYRSAKYSIDELNKIESNLTTGETA